MIMGTLSQIAAIITESSNIIGISLKFFFQVSSYMGRNFVNQIVYVFDYTNRLYQSTAAFAGVICEAFLVFYNDITEKIAWLASVTVNGISAFGYEVSYISSNILWFVTKTTNFTLETAKAFISAFFSLVSFVKACVTTIGELFLLIGSSVWMAVTKPPAAVLRCFGWIFFQLRNFLQGIPLFFTGIKNASVTSVKGCFISISTIPYTSFLGLFIGFILLYSTMKNYRTITSVILQISNNMYFSLSSLCYSCRNVHFFGGKQQESNEKIENDESNEKIENDEINDRLCVICLDKPKDMLIMQCNHVCLCYDCSHSYDKIYGCPICRSHIERIVKVYI